MRDDDGAFLAECGVTARVIAVVMRVDEIGHRLFGDLGDRRLELVVHGRELRIDHDDAIGAYGDRHVAAGALQHMGVLAQIGRFNFDLGKSVAALHSQPPRIAQALQWRPSVRCISSCCFLQLSSSNPRGRCAMRKRASRGAREGS
jgi:hypothetical protein